MWKKGYTKEEILQGVREVLADLSGISEKLAEDITISFLEGDYSHLDLRDFRRHPLVDRLNWLFSVGSLGRYVERVLGENG